MRTHELPTPLAAGWYRLTLRATAGAGPASAELACLAGDSAVARESFRFDSRLDESYALYLGEACDRVRLHLDAPAALGEFRLVRLGPLRLSVQAARAKWRLVRSYRCLGPALGRACHDLARGRFRTLSRKLVGGLRDERAYLPPASLLPAVAANPAPLPMSVSLAGELRGFSGYDRIVGALWKHLPECGVAVRPDARGCLRPEWPVPAVHPLTPPPTLRLVVGAPPILARLGVDTASMVLTMWESGHWEPEWIRLLNIARAVVVPTAHQARVLAAHGLAAPAVVVPLGYDDSAYFPAELWPTTPTLGAVAALGDGGVRKNVGQLVECFRAAFPLERGAREFGAVRLRLKLTPGPEPIDTAGDPRIDIVRAYLTDAELAAWYGSLSALVNLSSGEGFCLPVLEAMACGRAVVSPLSGGLETLLDESVAFALPAEAARAAVGPYAGAWGRVPDCAVIDALRLAASDPATVRAKGRAAAVHARRFTWRRTAESLADVLRSAPPVTR